jgi:cell division topological specificity factor
MAGLLDRLLGRNNTSGSAKIAKDRLQFVLVHDRLDLSPDKLREMEEEILGVISRYVRFDRSNVEISIEQRARDSWLVADIPLAADEEREED